MALTFGIEEEYLLIDTTTGALVPRSPGVLADAEALVGDSVSAELNRCQIEVATGTHERLDDARRELDHLRSELVAAGAQTATRPVALASHPLSTWKDQEVNRDVERYADLEVTYQQVAREQLICGCHVHVGLDDRDLQVATMARVLPWLPVLLALSANSPYWQGTDTGYASYRTQTWKQWPTAGFPVDLTGYRKYEELIEQLKALEVIDGPKSLYWYVRPSDQFPTLEYRVCDVCLYAADAVVIAGLIRGLTVMSADEAGRGRPYEAVPRPILDSALWRAARYGLDNTLIDPAERALRPASETIRHLLELAAPALESTGDTAAVHEGIETILRRGNGATIQRAALAQGGSQHDIMTRILAADPG